MPPRLVHLVRHAEGQHNPTWQHDIRDPVLTPLGHEQCRTLCQTFPHHNTLTKIISSPLKRAIQTTLESFHPAITRLSATDYHQKLVISPLFQPTGELEFNLGTSVPDLKAFLYEFLKKEHSMVNGYEQAGIIDFSPLEAVKEWPEKQGEFAAKNVVRRAEKAREYLWEMNGDEEVLVVSHGGYLHYLTEDWKGYNDHDGTAWKNNDYRSYILEKVDETVKMTEIEESIERRKVDKTAN